MPPPDDLSPLRLIESLNATLRTPGGFCAPGLQFTPCRSGYIPGERVEALVFTLDGQPLGMVTLEIEYFAGSGFAGQVYRAIPLGDLLGERVVAMKVLRPSSRAKNFIRDALFRLCYGAGFASRWRGSAVRSGLIWQVLLRQAAALELRDASAVARPLGYFWDPALCSFVELHEWVESRPVRYTVDDSLFLRSQEHPRPNEMSEKRRFMDRMVALCHLIGAHGIARQFEWYTGISQANVLSRAAGQPVSLRNTAFTAVDCRPGIAFPFFLPFTPVHLRIAWQGLRHGRLVHFDEADLSLLRHYAFGHPVEFAPLQPLIQRLEEDEACYRLGQPAPWSFRRERDASSAYLRSGRAEEWERMGKLSPDQAARLRLGEMSATRFFILLCTDWIPFVGSFLIRLAGNRLYRRRLRLLLLNKNYRRQAFELYRLRDLVDWLAAGRLQAPHAARLSCSLPAFWLEKLALGWLPPGLHRFCVEPESRNRKLDELLVLPLRLLFSQPARQAWLLDLIDRQKARGLVDAGSASRLAAQISEPRMDGFVRDLGFTVGLELFSKLIYLALAIYGWVSGDYLSLALAMLGPVPPSGVVRGVYTLAQLGYHIPGIVLRRDQRLLVTCLLGAILAPWRVVGNLFAPVEMFAYYPELSLLLASHIVTEMTGKVPVFGGRERLLDYTAFQLAYNLPLSLRRWLFRRRPVGG